MVVVVVAAVAAVVVVVVVGLYSTIQVYVTSPMPVSFSHSHTSI